MSYRDIDGAALDRYITGNWGEDAHRHPEFPEFETEVEFACPVEGCGEDLKFGVLLREDDTAEVTELRVCDHGSDEEPKVREAWSNTTSAGSMGSYQEDLHEEAAQEARYERDAEFDTEPEYDHEAYLERLEGGWN